MNNCIPQHPTPDNLYDEIKKSKVLKNIKNETFDNLTIPQACNISKSLKRIQISRTYEPEISLLCFLTFINKPKMKRNKQIGFKNCKKK